MLTGKRFWTLAMVLGLCVLATAGCRRKKSNDTTISNNGIFTTDNFPGAPVQDNNVSDDKRAFSTHTDDYNGGSLVCTHNGDRGTIMVTYDVDDMIFAHYYDGSTWTTGVALRNFDAYSDTTDAGEIIHAFINTDGDSRSDAADRSGDCLIFWNARDFDSDAGGADEENQNEYVSYFNVRHYSEAEFNHGFDIDPVNPGFFYAARLSSLEFSGEDVLFQGLVTTGLCGEARWQDGANVYSYGDETFAIFVFWHELEEKSPGVFDDVTTVSGFDLDSVVDEEFPIVGSPDVELVIQTFGASDSGPSCRETVVGREYSSYNDVLFRRVVSLVGASFGGVPAYGFAGFPGVDVDVTFQYTHMNEGTFILNTDTVNTYDPNSGVTSIDDMNSDFVRVFNLGFLGSTGMFTVGHDEGLSCLTTFFGETTDSDNTVGGGWIADEGTEPNVVIAEISEVDGTFLNDSEPSILDLNDGTYLDYIDIRFSAAAISRNGDYVWVAYLKITQLGTFDDYNFEYVQYLTTRLDSDGLPVAIPVLTTTLGLPWVFDPEDGGATVWLWQFQDNLGYVCGIQSDAQEMTFYWSVGDVGTGDSLIYFVRMTADVDGAVDGETVSSPSVLLADDVGGFYQTFQGLNVGHPTFNASDAGQDGDILYVFTYDDNDTNGLSDTYIAAGRFGTTAFAPIEMGSGILERHAQYDGDPLELVATPRGTEIGAWDVTNSQYDGGAHHGAEFVHLFFREAETASYPFGGPNTETGWAFRTRVYNTDDSGTSFGDDFTPNAGGAFRKPFDLDLPFIDPDDFDDAEPLTYLLCDNTVVVIFEQNGHLYYQEGNPGDNSDDQTGWREEAIGVSDPALIDDDTPELLAFFEDICTRSCTCCDIDTAAIFWVKNLDDGSSVDRLQVRVIGDGGNN